MKLRMPRLLANLLARFELATEVEQDTEEDQNPYLTVDEAKDLESRVDLLKEAERTIGSTQWVDWESKESQGRKGLTSLQGRRG